MGAVVLDPGSDCWRHSRVTLVYGQRSSRSPSAGMKRSGVTGVELDLRFNGSEVRVWPSTSSLIRGSDGSWSETRKLRTVSYISPVFDRRCNGLNREVLALAGCCGSDDWMETG